MTDAPRVLRRIFDASGVPFLEAREVAACIRDIAKRARSYPVLDGADIANWLEEFASNVDRPAGRGDARLIT